MNAVLTRETLVNKQEQLESKLWELLLLGETNGDVKKVLKILRNHLQLKQKMIDSNLLPIIFCSHL
ncbi:hypothetical protein ABWK43_27925 [Bacillus thuringiensis]|uniref:hypothetical protein n=1 Tax=Bacillus thuringiensis TaxID=1428 RepID=UPI003396B89E